MKKLLLFILVFAPFMSLSAQNAQTYRWDEQSAQWVYDGMSRYGSVQTGYTRQSFQNGLFNFVRPEPLVLPKNEFGFHFTGAPSSLTDAFDDYWYYDYNSKTYPISPWDVVNGDLIYKKRETTSYLLSLSYFYSPKNWVQLGALGTMRYHEIEYNDVLTREPYESTTDFLFAFTPTIRLNYVATKYLRMYVGVGYSFMWESEETSFGERNADFETDWDVTILGISLGHKLFVGFEAGYMASGYVKFVAGFRF